MMTIKAKNCTGEIIKEGELVYIEPDKRNWLQKGLGIKRKIIKSYQDDPENNLSTPGSGSRIFNG